MFRELAEAGDGEVALHACMQMGRTHTSIKMGDALSDPNLITQHGGKKVHSRRIVNSLPDLTSKAMHIACL